MFNYYLSELYVSVISVNCALLILKKLYPQENFKLL